MKSKIFNSYYHSNKKKKCRLMKRVPFPSLVIDLKNSEDDIFARFKKNTRNEIRRSFREDVEFNIFPDTLKGLRLHSKYFKENNLGRVSIDRFVDSPNIIITTAKFNSLFLSIHVYIFSEDKDIFRLLFSSTLPQKYGVDSRIVGWANKGLHWHDIKYAKDMKFAIYDLGGVPTGTNLEKKIERINQFKRSFGGEDRVYYNYIGFAAYVLKYINQVIYKYKKYLRIGS